MTDGECTPTERVDFRCSGCDGGSSRRIGPIRSIYSSGKSFSIDCCVSCGMGTTWPEPTPAELSALYSNVYAYPMHAEVRSEKRWRARSLIRSLGIQSGTVLDVGCMFGDFLDVALRNGASSGVGIEIDPDAAAVCRAKGFSVFDSLEALRGQPTRFDWIVLQHVLEHVPSDVEYVRELKQFLSPTGRIVICVPNFSCWSRSVFPRSWGWYQVPAHLRHYTPRSLETLLNRHGLVVKQIQTRGADSLMPMSTVMNILNRRVTSGKAVPGPLLQAVVRLNSFLLRYYLYLGSEEIVVEAGVN